MFKPKKTSIVIVASILFTFYCLKFLRKAEEYPVKSCGESPVISTRRSNSITDKSFYTSEPGVIFPPAILLEPKGRAGNQLFQYACHYALARKHGWPLYILLPSNEEDATDFILDYLNIPIFPENLVSVNWTIHGELGYFRDDTLLSGNYEDDEVLSQDGLDYCQSEVYFSEYKTELLGYFTQNHRRSYGKPTAFEEKWSARIKAVEESVGIHVRRGDFTDSNISVPITFHAKYMSVLFNKFLGRGVEFFVFSDDMTYVKDNLFNVLLSSETAFEDFSIIHLVSETEGGDPTIESTARGLQELFLMAECKHQIIPGSTFSWWAAYLNSNPDKIVYAASLKVEYFKEIQQDAYYEWHYKYIFYPTSWIQVDPGWSDMSGNSSEIANSSEKTNSL